MEPDDDRILALLHERYAGQGYDLTNWDRGDFVHAFGTPAAAILHSALFMPAFVEIGSHVFLNGIGSDLRLDPSLAENLVAAKRESEEQLRSTLSSYNWVEVTYLFGGSRPETDEEERLLADLMAEAWRARLALLFPERRFVVRVMEPEETGDSLGVGFEEISAQ